MSDEEKVENPEEENSKEEVVASEGEESSQEPKEGEAPQPEGGDVDDEDLEEALGEEGDANVSGEDLDKMIGEEDPLFQDELSKIKADDFANLVIESDQASEEVNEDEKGPSLWKSFFKNLPKEQKTRIYISLGIFSVLTPVIVLILMGKVLPNFNIPYNISMEELSGEIHAYPTDGVQVPLFDDYRSQAVTYELPKTMINLRKDGEATSFGEFEFFLNIREKELTSVIKDKETEIMDLIQRTLEQITWRELQTPIGKEKVKKVIRHRVNDFLQGNIVLGVYYRSIILQK